MNNKKRLTIYPFGLASIPYFPTMPKREYRKRVKEAYKKSPSKLEEFVRGEMEKYNELSFKNPAGIYGSYGFPSLLSLNLVKMKNPAIKGALKEWGSYIFVDPEELSQLGIAKFRKNKHGRFVQVSANEDLRTPGGKA